MPRPDIVDECIRCSGRYGVAIHTGKFQYMLGRDDALFELDMRNAVRAGLKVHNMMILTYGADGHEITDDEVVSCYLRVAEIGDRIGVTPAFEVHAEC